jgi:ankyrin repeat protein
MRRRGDGWLNATQILKVAGVEKGKRTKVLEKEILTGEHEKVQGGYGKYQGTWVSYQRGREFCRQYGVEDILRPLLDYDVHPDGSGGDGQETPTKEQAMAAQRKRFYNANQEQRPSGQGSFAGTFFQNISPTASVALAAMSKVQRLNSPAPRPSSAQQQKPSNMRHSSQPNAELPPESQQSNVSESTDNVDSGYGTQVQGEPPRKRMRTDDGHDGMGPPALPFDTSIVSATPTEPNESFIYDNALMMESKNGAGEPIALAPLPSPATEEQQEKMNLILDLFAEQGRMDYSSHPALTQLSNDDFNMPLDASANNALHWAATLAKVSLLKLLIQRGASIWRGNAAGQSPLISAVLVNNCWEHSCFPELLELLGPLIEVRDLQGRTILHHIAVSSGIKGRSPSSKYYLEALLEFLVRTGQANSSQVTTNVAAAAAAGLSESSQEANGESSNLDPSLNLGQPRGPITFVKFLQSIVNARDKAGNSALNLAARINNRSIIQQLLEIHADPSLPNNKGISAKDFGIGSETMEPTQSDEMFDASQPTSQLQVDPAFQRSMMASQNGESQLLNSASQVEEMGQDVISCV